MPSAHRSWLILTLAISLSVGYLVWLRVTILPPGTEVSVDSYYHITMADGCPSICFARTFPSLTFSILREHFSNFSLLYHMLLASIREYSAWLGLSLEPSFHVPVVLFTGTLLATLLSILAA